MRWSDKVRTFTNQAVKQGAAALGQNVPVDGQIGKFLRKFSDEPTPAPLRDPSRIFMPSQRDGFDLPQTRGIDRERGRALLAGGERRIETAAPVADGCGAFAALAASLPDLAPNQDRREIAVGDVIGDRYEVRRLIGTGPAYRVYAAWHRPWGIEVVLKVPRPDASAWPALPSATLSREALRWTGLGLHPHIVYCHYVDSLADLPLVVVEARPGGSLRPWIASGRTQNLRIGLSVAIQICHGLERAHGEGLWHGGLRPENLLLDAGDTIAISDFGLASAAHLPRAEADAAAARKRDIEPYVAPELWVDPAALDARSDLFALGVCLWEMFTGRRPFEVARGPRREPSDPSAPAGPLPPRLAALLYACVDWEAANRPLCAREVRAELCDVHRELYRRANLFEDLEESSWDADGWNNQAVALHLLGHADAADAAWAQSLGAAPLHLEATYNAGLIGWSRGELSDAALRAAVASAAARRTPDARSAALVADLCLRGGEIDAALAQLEAVSGLDDEGQALLERARRRRGSAAGLATQWVGHRGYVGAVQLLDGGQRAVTASDDGTLAIWAAGRPEPQRVLEGHVGAVSGLIASSDGRRAVSGGDDGTLKVWELRTGRCIKSVAIGGKVLDIGADAQLTRAIAACTSSDNFVGVDNTTLFVWDLERGRTLAQLSGHTAAAKCVSLSGDGRIAVSGSDDHSVRIWDLTQGGGCRRVMRGHTHYVSAVALSADASRIVSGGWDTTVRVWDAQTGRCLRVLRGHEGLIHAVALSRDGKVLVSSGWDRTVRVWDVDSGRCLRTFGGHEGIVAGVTVSPDGALAASASWDRTARLWRLPASNSDAIVPRLSRRLAIAALPSGEPEPDELLEMAETALSEGRVADALHDVGRARAAAGDLDAGRALGLWRALTALCPRDGVRGLLPQASWSPAAHATVHPSSHSRQVFEALPSGPLRLWDPDLERLQRVFEGHAARACAVAVGERVAVSAGADTLLHVWELATGTPVRVLDGHTSIVAAVALSADGCTAMSGGYDHAVRLWDLAAGRCQRIMDGHQRQVTSVGLDAACGRAISGDLGGAVRVWTLPNQHDEGAAEPASVLLAEQGAAITAVRLSADGGIALAASADGSLRAWRADSGAALATLAGHADAILDVDVSADGRWALSIDAAGAARVWSLPEEQPVATFGFGAPLRQARVLLDASRVTVVEPSGRAHLLEVDWALVAPLSPAPRDPE